MKLVKVRTTRKKNWSKGTFIYRLISNGKLKAYRNELGDLMYDVAEYNAYQKKEHRGRPRTKQFDITDVKLKRGKKECQD